MNSRPVTPVDSDCCGNGCNPCIFDVHRKLVEDWKRAQSSIKPYRVAKNILTQTKYKSFVISNLYEACANCMFVQLTFEGVTDADTTLFLNPGQHVMLRGLLFTRPYTPISWTNNSLLILVKIYSHGKFSRSLEQMKVGDHIDVRGPYGNFIYKLNSFEDILMLSIGSGIAALYPIAKSIIDNELEETRVHLIAGFESSLHIPLKEDLRRLSHFWNFSCTIKLSQKVSDNRDEMNGIKLQNGRVENSCIADFLKSRSPTNTLVLICGTPEFNKTALQWIHDVNHNNYHVFQ